MSGNRSFYADAEYRWATPCCGIVMCGDIVENETQCPYCDQTFAFEDDECEEEE